MEINKTLRAKNTAPRRGKVDFIVLHDTAGNGTVNDAKYLANDPEKRGVSVDFCIVKDGTIYQLNHDLAKRVTFHAGRRTRFRGLSNGSVNHASIGIEIAQTVKLPTTGPIYPDVQVRAVAYVCRKLCKEFNLVKEDITTHKKIITDGSRSDPREFPWDSFWQYFNEGVTEDQPQLGHVTHTVVAGDTLYSLARTYSTTVEAIKALNNMDSPEMLIHVGQVLIVKE